MINMLFYISCVWTWLPSSFVTGTDSGKSVAQGTTVKVQPGCDLLLKLSVPPAGSWCCWKIIADNKQWVCVCVFAHVCCFISSRCHSCDTNPGTMTTLQRDDLERVTCSPGGSVKPFTGCLFLPVASLSLESTKILFSLKAKNYVNPKHFLHEHPVHRNRLDNMFVLQQLPVRWGNNEFRCTATNVPFKFCANL